MQKENRMAQARNKPKTRATPDPVAAPDPAPPVVKICFERIIPDALDPERLVRRELRSNLDPARAPRGALDADDVAGRARMAILVSKKWPPESVVRCRFLDGSPKMRSKVKAIALQWQKHAAVKLKFVAAGAAEIRISFYADAGSWSAVGRDALNTLYFPPHQPTMNYGWLRDDSDPAEYQRVVLHEFGHALGCVHEHQTPTFTRKWNRNAVLKYFQGPPNYWSPADIESNVLAKYSPNGVAATQYDPKSIMLYDFDAALFADGLGPTNTNNTPSKLDVQMIGRMYPKKAQR